MAKRINGETILTKAETEYLAEMIDSAWDDFGKERTLTSFRDVVTAVDTILSTAEGMSNDEG